MGIDMLGFTFWKRATGDEQPESLCAMPAFDRRHARRRILSGLALAGAAIAIVAIVADWPLTGLVIYLVSLLPYVLSA